MNSCLINDLHIKATSMMILSQLLALLCWTPKHSSLYLNSLWDCHVATGHLHMLSWLAQILPISTVVTDDSSVGWQEHEMTAILPQQKNHCTTIKNLDQAGPSLLPFVSDPSQSIANAFLHAYSMQSSPAPLCTQVMWAVASQDHAWPTNKQQQQHMSTQIRACNCCHQPIQNLQA